MALDLLLSTKRRALTELQENKDIVLKPAEKGGGNSCNGCDGPIASIKSEIDSLLQHASDQNWIIKCEHEFLKVTYSVTPVIYYLTKVHKNPTQPPSVLIMIS
uniref:Uncharacterized protein n=1 Tax=Salmo trutta TaxID=8032 RepID=A0A674BKR6_SALTR